MNATRDNRHSRFPNDRVGGEVAFPVLPHHRAYGSVHGGS